MGGLGVDVRMDYDKMEEMASAYKQAQSDLGSVAGQITQIQSMIDDGALVGDAADEFQTHLDKLQDKLSNLEEKMKELTGDIQGAVSKMRDGVSTAQSRFA